LPDSATPIGTDNSRAQRELIAQLESKNKEIMREIARLRRQQETEQMAPENPALLNPRVLQKITVMYVYTGIPESLL